MVLTVLTQGVYRYRSAILLSRARIRWGREHGKRAEDQFEVDPRPRELSVAVVTRGGRSPFKCAKSAAGWRELETGLAESLTNTFWLAAQPLRPRNENF